MPTVPLHRSTRRMLSKNWRLGASEWMIQAMINWLTGYEDGGRYCERQARNCADFTDHAFKVYLLALAKRQILYHEDVPGAARTVRRSLDPDKRYGPLSSAIVALAIARIYYRVGEVAVGMAYHATAIAFASLSTSGL